MIYRFIFIILLVGFGFLTGYSQQGNNWYFSDSAGISFNSSVPVSFLGGSLYTIEGCASISDNNGQTLFYTDGSKVWNRLNQVMPNGNGLKGDPSTSNSAIIIPKPNSGTIFYIFTADAAENANEKGYNYSEVDMTLNGGLGDVTTNKNILLYAPSTEKLTAVRDANGIDIWVITKAWGNNAWYTYKVDCNGVSSIPVISYAGSVYNETSNVIIGGLPKVSTDGSVGCLKASPDGKKIAATKIIYFGSNIWEIFDFNNTTGGISNPLKFDQPTPYGLEFSPDSKLLYVASENINHAYGEIIQYNLTNYNATAIQASAVSIGKADLFTYIGALQLGPDNKIYCILELERDLAVINNPNASGVACNYVNHQIDLKGRQALRGLPVFFPGLLANQNAVFNYTVMNNCSTVNFSANSTVAGNLTWSWDFGDGTTASGQQVSHSYTNGGSNLYPVKLTVTSNMLCGSAIAEKQINLNRIVANAKFDFAHQCGDLTIALTDLSTISGATIQSWSWDFGDGNGSNQQNPNHTYANYGDYTVKLSVTSAGACNGTSDTISLIPIEAKPISAFSHPATCAGKPIQFRDISSISAGSIGKWYWDFGDGTNSTMQHPSKIFGATNDFIVKLVTTSSTGCVSDTVTQNIQVSDNPAISFSVIDTCFTFSTQFTGKASVNNATVSNWWWDLGDGTNASVQNISHVYSAPGVYNILFVASANTGCTSDTIGRSVLIGSKPLANFSFTDQCGNLSVPFTNIPGNNNDAVTRWAWNFGDNNVSMESNPVYKYAEYSVYTVRLVVKSALGCVSDTAQRVLDLRAKPVAAFDFLNGCEHQQVIFNDGSSITSGNIAQWKWDLGNNIASQQPSPSDTYNVYGNYLVKLVVISDKLCISDTLVKTISIEPKPISEFSVTNGCVDQLLLLQNKNTIQFGEIVSSYWDFGDGDISSQANPSYRYKQFGSFVVKELAVSKNGCGSDTAYSTVNIESNPVVDFSFGNTCAGKEINFLNLSSNSYGSIDVWKWNFGNGAISSVLQPAYTYTQFGNCPVNLTAYTDQGCIGSATKNISISKVNVSAGNDTIASVGQPLLLLASGADQYTWSPASYLNDPHSDHPVAELSGDMVYYLEGITAEGCRGYDTILVKVYKGPDIYVPNAFTPNADGKNDVFKPILPGISKLDYFRVYNRWGQIIFTTNETGKGWDGRMNGTEQLAGTFVWMLRARDYTGKLIEKKGTVVLIR